MIKPPIPSNELQRLQTLRGLKLLDTLPEERFDRVTRLAVRAFGVPIALVSLVDNHRQWFKSRQGLDAQETPREISFCGHAILKDQIMVVDDATTDERFADNPLVTCDPNIRFYAGYPISAPDGNKIGTLCVIDRKPRKFSQEDRHLLRELGRMIEEELIDESLVTTDPVTGLSNLFGLENIASHLLPLCERMEKPLSFLMYSFNLSAKSDIDMLITNISHMLLATFRDSDVIARVDEDVFVVLLAGVDLHGAARAEQRFEQMMSESNREAPPQDELVPDVVQVAYHPGRHGLSILALIEEAEKRLIDTASAEVG